MQAFLENKLKRVTETRFSTFEHTSAGEQEVQIVLRVPGDRTKSETFSADDEILFFFNWHFHDYRKVTHINRKQKLKHHPVSHLIRYQQITLLTLDFLDPRQELSLHITQITHFCFSCLCRHPVAHRQWTVEVHQSTECPAPAAAARGQAQWALLADIPPSGHQGCNKEHFYFHPHPTTSLLKEIFHFPHSNHYHHDNNKMCISTFSPLLSTELLKILH